MSMVYVSKGLKRQINKKFEFMFLRERERDCRERGCRAVVLCCAIVCVEEEFLITSITSTCRLYRRQIV